MNLSDYAATQPRGFVGNMSRELNAHLPDVSRWVSGQRPVPVAYAAAIERITHGAVTRRDLFPKSWGLIWPELITPQHPWVPHQPAVSSEVEL